VSKYQKTATYNKLVRDKIPDIIKKDGLKPDIKILSEEEAVLELKKKIIEEASEFVGASSVDEIVVELADLREVEKALMERLKIREDLVEKVRIERREKRGGFDDNIFLIGTSEE
jgi:predicted house-cleaning noncanonical NTP pyrophosphatase (MazG superfamily)